MPPITIIILLQKTKRLTWLIWMDPNSFWHVCDVKFACWLPLPSFHCTQIEFAYFGPAMSLAYNAIRVSYGFIIPIYCVHNKLDSNFFLSSNGPNMKWVFHLFLIIFTPFLPHTFSCVALEHCATHIRLIWVSVTSSLAWSESHSRCFWFHLNL